MLIDQRKKIQDKIRKMLMFNIMVEHGTKKNFNFDYFIIVYLYIITLWHIKTIILPIKVLLCCIEVLINTYV